MLEHRLTKGQARRLRLQWICKVCGRAHNGETLTCHSDFCRCQRFQVYDPETGKVVRAQVDYKWETIGEEN